MILINLDDIGDIELYVTGTIVYTQDPVNIHIENVYLDTWNVIAGFMFWPRCNYPEAFTTPTVYVSNFTSFVSSQDSPSFMPNVFYYAGPGNITALNINLTNSFGLSTLGLAVFLMSVEPTCLPDDGLTKTYELHTVYISIKNNPFKAKTNIFAVNLVGDSTRVNIVNATDVNIVDVSKASFPLLFIFVQQTDVVYYSDSYNQNYETFFTLMLLTSSKFLMFYINNTIINRNVYNDQCHIWR